MRYSIEPRERKYVEGSGFLSFAGNLVTHATKVSKNLNNKYGQKLADSAKYLQQMHLKLLAKEQLAMKYQKKDMYLHKKDKKLLMN